MVEEVGGWRGPRSQQNQVVRSSSNDRDICLPRSDGGSSHRDSSASNYPMSNMNELRELAL